MVITEEVWFLGIPEMYTWVFQVRFGERTVFESSQIIYTKC